MDSATSHPSPGAFSCQYRTAGTTLATGPRVGRLEAKCRRVLVLSAPQVHVTPVPEAQQLQEVLAGLPVLLECQVSPPDAPIRWLKDGEAVVPTNVLAVCSEGCSRRLHIPTAAPSDSGTYTCNAGDDAASFRVIVSGELPGGAVLLRGSPPTAAEPSCVSPGRGTSEDRRLQ